MLHDTELKEYIDLKIKKDDWLPDEVAGFKELERTVEKIRNSRKNMVLK